MKFIFLFFALLSLSLCDTTKINKLIAVEDAFVNVKKNILECKKKYFRMFIKSRKCLS